MLALLYAFATVVLAALAADVSINTPKSITQCKRMTITWQGGKGPYSVFAVPSEDPCADPLVEIATTNDTWYHWDKPALDPGTKIILAIQDESEDEAWTNEITIQQGDDSSCAAASTTPAVNGPVVNPEAVAPGGSLGAAPSGTKGGIAAVSAGLMVALASAFVSL